MANGCASEAFRQVARVFQEGTLAGLEDGEILGRFVEGRDEAAFELLLRRHGPMVRNVCRQTLFDPHEAEDAFQATFLALVCKASALRVEGSVGPWLYRVASRISARARANRRRRREREAPIASLPEPTSREDPDRGEISRIVHEELGRLPERLRAPLVLCYLEGMTHELAARQLRCPVGTVRSRLARARALLQERIARRGLVTSAVAMAAALESTSRAAALPPQLAKSLITVAAQLASGSSSIRSGMGVSASVAVLLEGLLNVMRVKKLVSLAGAMVAVGALAVVVGVSVFPATGQTGNRSEARVADESARPVGPDGRPIGPRRKPTGAPTVAKTREITKAYYIGDLASAHPAQAVLESRYAVVRPVKPEAGDGRARPGTGSNARQAPDVTAIIELVATTIAPGTWQITDLEGKDMGPTLNLEIHVGGIFTATASGSITPSADRFSLIIVHDKDVHTQIADLLRRVRRLPVFNVAEEARERPTPPPSLPHQAHPTDPKPVTPQPIGGEALIPPFMTNPAAAGSSHAKPTTPQPNGGKVVVPLSQDKRELFKYHGDMLDDERRKLIEYYQQQGFYEANVTPDVKAGKDLGELELTFVIHKGPRYHVRDVIIEGNHKLKTNVLKEDLELHSGRPFLQAVRDADKNRMLSKYRKIGCIDTKIAVEPKFTNEPGIVDLVYKIVEGDPYILGELRQDVEKLQKDQN